MNKIKNKNCLFRKAVAATIVLFFMVSAFTPAFASYVLSKENNKDQIT